MKIQQTWEKMEKVALNSISYYMDDFYKHDRNTISNLGETTRIFWSVGDCGTHLARIDGDNYLSKDYIDAVVKTYNKNTHYEINFVTGRLTKVTAEQAKQLIK